MLGRVVQVAKGVPREYPNPFPSDHPSKTWRTSFFREPIEGKVTVGPRGIDGDEVADKVHHGKPTQGLLAYAAGHYPTWRAELDLPDIGPGGFGENLTIAGVDENGVCLGDRLRIGSTAFAVMSPRYPCWKIDYRWKRKGITGRVAETGRCGWYLRVEQPGTLAAGDVVELIERHESAVTVATAARAAFGPKPFADAASRVVESSADMDPELREAVRGRMAKT